MFDELLLSQREKLSVDSYLELGHRFNTQYDRTRTRKDNS